MTSSKKEEPPSEDRGSRPINRHMRQVDINRRIHAEFLDLPKHVAWESAHVVDSVVIRTQEGHWQILVKAARNGNRYVAFINGGSFADAVELCGDWASRGILPWQRDKYPPRPRKKGPQ